MCGIAGIIHFNQRSDYYKNEVKLLSDALRHRGPDAEGFYFDNNVSLAHRRLSIIDLSEKANQPMQSRDGNIVIVFNGEIYNYRELRNELEKEYEFKTDHSDTETIIYAYEKWGIDCIHKLTGMFAFALYDRKKGKVFLVRDRLGKKPLYYFHLNNKLYFSSEIQAFFSADLIPKELNEEAIYHYLTFLTVNAPSTFFKGIDKLESGHYLEISGKNVKKVKYWDISEFLNKESRDSYEEACDITEKLLIKSMEYRNIADVPIVVSLSGGLDSSLNLYYSSKINKNISSINISYAEKSPFDESEAAEKYSNQLNVRFINKKIDSEDFKNIINEYLLIQRDMPVGDPNTALMYLISKVTKQNGAKVMLVGEGGDELGGYPIYLKLNKEVQRFNNLPSFILNRFKYLPSIFTSRLDFFFKGKIISKRHIHGFSENSKKGFWLGKKEYNSYKILSDYMSEIRDDLEDSFLRKISNVEYKLRLPELILARIDYPSMAGSIEARSPFMDHKLIEYSCTLPFNLKMKNGSKSILKNGAKNKLPDYILNHPKVGFGMLLNPFLRDTMPVWFYKEVVNADVPLKKYINNKLLKSLYCAHQKTKMNGYKMWIIFSLNRWLMANNF